MTPQEKIKELKDIIYKTLTPLIEDDFYLLEVPYYNNIGDTLIWQGERDFLKKLDYKFKGEYSGDTFRFPRISNYNILLLQGGGNFGDLYPFNHNFKMEVIKRYPKNRIIIFPQTIWFQKESNLIECANFLSTHKNVIICARDNISYKIFQQYFKNKILLLPDMAFCIDIKAWDIHDMGGKHLLLKRDDKELKTNKKLIGLETDPNVDVTDWPTMLQEIDIQTRYLNHFKSLRYKFPNRLSFALCDIYAQQIYRKHLIRSGIKTIRSHDHIFTTRLHTAILSVLLKKDYIGFFDNSYGKNKNFYETWLADCDNITLIDND